MQRSYHRNLQARSVAGGEREQPSEPVWGGGGAVTSSFSVSGIVANIGWGSTVTIRFIVTVAAPDGTTEDFEEDVEVGPDGTGDLEIGTEVCAACTTTVLAAECVSGECDGYDEKETNDNLVASVSAVWFSGVGYSD